MCLEISMFYESLGVFGCRALVAYKIFNIDVERTKIVAKMQTMDGMTKNLEVEHFLKVYSKLDFALWLDLELCYRQEA